MTLQDPLGCQSPGLGLQAGPCVVGRGGRCCQLLLVLATLRPVSLCSEAGFCGSLGHASMSPQDSRSRGGEAASLVACFHLSLVVRITAPASAPIQGRSVGIHKWSRG